MLRKCEKEKVFHISRKLSICRKLLFIFNEFLLLRDSLKLPMFLVLFCQCNELQCFAI